MPLTYNFIKLPCNHSFNYLPLYNELTLTNTYKRSIKCPYCRTLSSKLIPYIPLPGVEKNMGLILRKNYVWILQNAYIN